MLVLYKKCIFVDITEKIVPVTYLGTWPPKVDVLQPPLVVRDQEQPESSVDEA